MKQVREKIGLSEETARLIAKLAALHGLTGYQVMANAHIFKPEGAITIEKPIPPRKAARQQRRQDGHKTWLKNHRPRGQR